MVAVRDIPQASEERVRPRHPAEAHLLGLALEGDLKAVNQVLQYLSSSDPNLLRIMQETVHDLSDVQLWHHLLACLATHRWETAGGGRDCERRADPLASERIDQAIMQLFTFDENQWEKPAKEAILHAGLEEQAPEIRHAAVLLLALRGDPQAIPGLGEILDFGKPQWKLRAVEAMCNLHDERCGFVLIKALAVDNEVLHRAARHALIAQGPLAEPAYLLALNHPDSHIRWHAARGLGMLGNARAVELLAQGLYDDNLSVRWATAGALARLDAAAVPAILKVLITHKISESLRRASYHALHAMSSPHTQERLRPLLETLRSSGANLRAPGVAQRLLAEWDLAETDDRFTTPRWQN